MSAIPKYRTRGEAMVDFKAGRCPRWVYVDGWQVDLIAPEGNRAEEPPAGAATTQPAREGGNRNKESIVNETMTETTATNSGTPPDLQLAACLAAAEGAIDGPYAIGPNSPSWSAAYQAIVDLRRERDRLRAEAATRRMEDDDGARPLSPLAESALRCLAEAMVDRGGSPAEIRIVDRRSRYTVSHDLRVGIDHVKVVVGPYPPPPAPSHLRVVTRRPSGATGPVEIVAVCETDAAANALVDEIAAERTPSGRHPMWFAQAIAYPVRR